MKPLSPGKSDRLTKFATMLHAGCESTKGRRRNWLALVAVPSLVLVAAIGCFTAARAEAAPQPSHQDIQNSVGAVQTTVNGTNSTVNSVQTTVNGIDTKVDAIKSTLDQIPPAWSQILPTADRFRLVMGGAAVLDRETGLVWEQSPDTTVQDWFNAQYHCNNRTVGGRLGWRLPTLQELASLVDPNNPGGDPDLPPGHPFSNVQSFVYWSATTLASDTSSAWVVNLINGDVSIVHKALPPYVWCVRGGQGVDHQ